MPVELQTNRLKLRRFEAHDAEAMYRYRSDARVTKFQTWEPKDVQEVETFISQLRCLAVDTPGTWFQLAITLKESQILVGDCGIHFLDADDGQVELGITIAPDHQGRGYASEGLTSVLAYLFNQLSKHRVIASADPGNQAAIALLERIGMRREAHFRKSLWWKNNWADELVYAILAETWATRQLEQPS